MKSKPLKIVAVTIGLVALGSIAFVSNVFLGNPISAYLAENAIKDYVATTYPDLDLKISKAHYNFKSTDYMAYAQSKSSPDTHFSIYYEKGEITQDHFQDYVAGKFNTLLRLEEECTKEIIPLLEKIQGLDAQASLVQISKDTFKNTPNDLIILDMPYEKSLPLEMTLYLQSKDALPSLKNATKMLTETHQVLQEAGYDFFWYDLVLSGDGELLEILNVTASDIESNILEERLLAAIQDGLTMDEEPDYQKQLSVFRKIK